MGRSKMTPEQALDTAQQGKLQPIYLLVGDEQYWQSRVQKALREACMKGGIAGLNEDQFTAAETDARTVLSACKTLPMMAKRRFVLVRSLERWEAGEQLDQLATYLDASSETTVLVLVASKLDMRRKFCAQAKKRGLVIECESPKPAQLPAFIQSAAKSRGNTIARATAELIATLVGSDLAQLDDVAERLSLFVGNGKEITEDAVASCLDTARPATVWELVSAVGKRDAGASLAALSRVAATNESEIRLLGLLAWSARQLIRFAAARQEGLSAQEAALKAGAPPFKAGELQEQLRHVSVNLLIQWLETLARADLDLKGGSRRKPQAVLEEAILTLCGPSAARA
ncbi:MAG TPA: DNA polymerase III subunit delta [Polyangiaceae bacterium]|jgi:DNA polymerase-3 subunit delta|nr:DNA polymerase III subunit delta [Polyangiaceae bacterium]